MERKLQYSGTGAGLFGNLFAGLILCIVTLGIYTPWFIARLYKYIYSNTSLTNVDGPVRFDFKGSGAQFFGIMIIGVILTIITLGIYYPWFMVNMTKFIAENTVGRDEQGREFTGSFDGSGVKLFGIFIVGVILSVITLGIYSAWFACNLQKFFTDHTTIKDNGEKVGSFEFDGSGGELLGTMIIGIILTAITFGIYYPWFMVNLTKFFAAHTSVTVNGEKNKMDFVGTGAALFGILLVGTILTCLTLGIYWFWFMTNQIKFGTENLTFKTTA